MKLKVNEKTIFLGKRQIILDYKIDTAYKMLNKIIVRFEVTKDIVQIPRFHNIICIDLNGNLLWQAELPSDDNLILYYDIFRYWPKIIAHSLSYDCEINIKTGKIIRKRWFK